MLTRLHITVLLVAATLLWGIALWFLGVPLSWEYVKPFAATVTGLTAVVLVFERFGWKWPVFRGWLVQVPNIQGTWQVALQSSYVDPATGQRIGPIHCAMVIRQTFSTLSLRLITKESGSVLITHKIIPQNDRVFELAGVYRNTPQVHLRGQRSEIHYGALLLEMKGEPVVGLQGHYWTDRLTKGTLDLSNRRKKLIADYAEAVKMYRLDELGP